MAKSMSLLWGAGSPPCWRVMIALEEKKLQGYKHKLMSFEKGEHKSKEVFEVNPRGQDKEEMVRLLAASIADWLLVAELNLHSGNITDDKLFFCIVEVPKLPAFKHEDIIVNESIAACLYLENQFKSQGSKLIPDSPAEQAVMFQRMMEGVSLTDKLNSVIYYEWFVPEEERSDSAVKRNKEDLTTELKLWESYLQNVAAGSYLAGSFSLADVVVFPNIAYAFRFGLSVGRYPKLAKYYSLLKDRPSIKTSWPPHWLPSPQGYDILRDL